MSLAQMVWACDLPGRQYLMNMESGKMRPSLRVLTKIAGVFKQHLINLVSLPEQSLLERLLVLIHFLNRRTIERLIEEVERLPTNQTPSS